MRDWLRQEPIVLKQGRGSVVYDVSGREYIDANSSIWTNVHGHRQPRIDAAIRAQLAKIAHSSALGLANEPASRLGAALVRLANPASVLRSKPSGRKPAAASGVGARLERVFFSDDGSTALEVALKLTYEYSRRKGCARPRFASVAGAYHGDTIGAVSLGQIDLFHSAYRGLLFHSERVMSPYCYRCPYNRAKPERADAREYRKCNWECVDRVAHAFERAVKCGRRFSAFVFEPRIQGAAGMIPQPAGWLGRTTEIARGHGALLIADEVMTGFGRACEPPAAGPRPPSAGLFASHDEGIQPDFLCLAKGLTGGYLPMAATLTTPAVFEAFLGEYEEFRTFFHGHSYTANQLGASAALANLKQLESRECRRQRRSLARDLQRELARLWELPAVGDIRQVGTTVGVELVRNWRTRKSFELRERAGMRVCDAMARRGVLTRPIGNVIVVMPPYGTTRAQVARIANALAGAISEVLGKEQV